MSSSEIDWIPVQGASMSPFLQPGDEVGVRWLEPAAELRPGDIVIAREPDSGWLVHRVIGRWRLKGDSSFAFDSLTRSQIWGKVIEVRSRGGARPLCADETDSRLDRLIAYFSALSLPPGRLRSRVARRIARALGAIRRRRL